jgi:hypothetical protein
LESIEAFVIKNRLESIEAFVIKTRLESIEAFVIKNRLESIEAFKIKRWRFSTVIENKETINEGEWTVAHLSGYAAV